MDIVAHVDRNNPAALVLLEKIVNINSGTTNQPGVRAVGQMFAAEFQSLGFTTEWVDGSSFNRAGHLIASRGSKGPRILLIGHLDTVFEPNNPFQKYEVVSEGAVKGPGITDMKGGDVIILKALTALDQAGVLDTMSVKVILTGDEERRGSPLEAATRRLIEAGRWADIALGFEDGDGNPDTAVISRRGAISWQLAVTGRPAHSSQIFVAGYGDGAIFETARILNEFRVALAGEENLTLNPGILVGGTSAAIDASTATGSAFGKNNVIPETTLVEGDLRAVSPAQLIRAQKIMTVIVAKNLAETGATISFSPGYPPMAPSPANKQLLARYSRASLDLGFGEVQAVNPRSAGAADISFVAQYVGMALDGLGLMGSGGHTVNEVADIGTLSTQTKRAALLLFRLGNPRLTVER